MKFKLDSPNQLGELVRATRKHQAMRQDLLAEMLGVSENFMGRLENGADTMQWGKLFGVLNALGIKVIVDLPAGVEEELARREQKNRKTQKKTFESFTDRELALDLKADTGGNNKLGKSAPLDLEPELGRDKHYSNQLSGATAAGPTFPKSNLKTAHKKGV